MKNQLNKLLQRRIESKEIEKETKYYQIENDASMQLKHFTAKKLRKKTEKAIFKILEDGKEKLCDCEIPKPIDAYHPIDKNICKDCNLNINTLND